MLVIPLNVLNFTVDFRRCSQQVRSFDRVEVALGLRFLLVPDGLVDFKTRFLLLNVAQTLQRPIDREVNLGWVGLLKVVLVVIGP